MPEKESKHYRGAFYRRRDDGTLELLGRFDNTGLDVIMGFRKKFPPKVKKVTFNGPATIVFWEDGTKTVVKAAEGDRYNPIVGYLMCHIRKIYTGKEYSEFCKDYARVVQAYNFTNPFDFGFELEDLSIFNK